MNIRERIRHYILLETDNSITVQLNANEDCPPSAHTSSVWLFCRYAQFILSF